jgi:hypothetical protein
MKKTVLLMAIILLSGCALAPINPGQQQQLNKTVPVCVNDKDCKDKWSAAQIWVTRNCGMKIQMVTDTIIQTHNSCDHCTELACSVIKEPIGNEKYRLLISAGCDNIFGCFPDSWVAALNFNKYVGSIGSNDIKKVK